MKIDFPTNNTTAYRRPRWVRINTHCECFSKWKSNLTTNGISFFPSDSLLFSTYFCQNRFFACSPFTHNFAHTRKHSDSAKEKERKSNEERKDNTRRASREASIVGERCVRVEDIYST